jgi:hypothetical protein
VAARRPSLVQTASPAGTSDQAWVY